MQQNLGSLSELIITGRNWIFVWGDSMGIEKVYGLKPDTSKEEIVAFLMKRYEKLTKK